MQLLINSRSYFSLIIDRDLLKEFWIGIKVMNVTLVQISVPVYQRECLQFPLD